MILMDFNFFFAIWYNAETWKIYSVPCNSTLNKFYCITIPSMPIPLKKYVQVYNYDVLPYIREAWFEH
jgi:hypothetical protein